jgi:methyl-accepting chemotaxis protein/methyl-accepting chemotaxis protein-1 (serine sensor receptor)
MISGVAIMLGITLVSSILALRAISGLGRTVEQTASFNSRSLSLAEQVRTAAYQARFGSRGISLGLIRQRPNDVATGKRLFQDSADRIQKIADDLRPLMATPAEREALKNLEGALPRWSTVRQAMFGMADAGDIDGLAKVQNGDAHAVAEAVDNCTTTLIGLETKAMEQATAEAKSSSRWAYILQVVFLAVAAVAGGTIVTIVWRLGRELSKVAENLNLSADRVASTSQQIGAQGQTLARAASDQAASLEETSSAAEEVTAITQQSRENTSMAAKLMSEVDQATQAGAVALQETISSMALISASSDGISKIIRVIDEIAFQTNILALNAAVEAARAGESGMGFAVVADEVRNLAGRCGQAAKDTAGMIEQSIERSRDGSAKLQKLSDLVRSIVTRTHQVKGLVDQVRTATEQHSSGIDQIAKTVAQLGETTQQTAAGAQENAASGAEMTVQAQDLRADAQMLEMLVGARDAG